MTAYTQTQRVADQYRASHQPGHGRVFEPITIAEAGSIVAPLVLDGTYIEQYNAVEAWLASLGDKVTDEQVIEDAEHNGAITCSLAIGWADDKVRRDDRDGRVPFPFLDDMVMRLRGRKGLYAGQIRGLLNCWRADVQREARRIAEEIANVKPFTDDDLDITPAPAPVAPFANVVAFLQRLSESGLKRPKVRIVTEAGDPIAISVAGANSRNPGHLNVTDGKPFGSNVYFGRIDLAGKPNPPLSQRAAIIAALTTLNADPEGALVQFGRITGACGICGRELTDPVSVARGIGPICAGKGGF